MSQEFLQEEMEHYKLEQEKVKQIVGSIGGAHQSRKHKMFNAIFLTIVVVSFFMGGILHYIPVTLSLELGVLLVSLKIAWMIHEQQKVNHFQFWILNSLEIRLNSLQTSSRKINKELSLLREENEKLISVINDDKK
jgi:heme O synthase-like polyprenyltransferase